MKSSRIRRSVVGGCAAVLSLAVFAACGSGESDTPAGPDESKVVDELREQLPEAIHDKGSLNIATSIYPPVGFYESDGKTLTGFDYEIVEEMAARLGVTVDWKVIDFASIMPGIQSGQYDFATNLNDTAEREEVMDFVTEFKDGTSIMVAEGNPEGIEDLEDLCGRSVVATKGSTQIALIDTQNQTCVDNGDDAINKMEVPDDPDAILTMQNGRAEVYLVNTLAGSYAVEERGVSGVEILPTIYDEVYAGFVFPKENAELRDAIQAAMQSLIDDGTYQTIMSDYGLDANAIDEARVNVASES